MRVKSDNLYKYIGQLDPGYSCIEGEYYRINHSRKVFEYYKYLSKINNKLKVIVCE
jgi:hypothetical protein